MFGLRHRLALAGAALLLAGVGLQGAAVAAEVVHGAAPGSADGGGGAVLGSAAVAVVPVVGRARSWAEAELGPRDQLVRAPLVALATGLGWLLLVAGLWWLSRPDRRVASPQCAVTSAASRAPPVLV